MIGVVEIGERLAKKGVSATRHGDRDRVIRGEGCGQGGVERRERWGDRGGRGFRELLEGGEGDAVGVELVEGLWRLGSGIGWSG